MESDKCSAFIIEFNSTILEAMKKIDINAKGILFVVGRNKRLIGSITDGDIRRWIINNGCIQEKVTKAMNRAPKMIMKEDISFAQSIMKQYTITVLPVVDKFHKIIRIIFNDSVRLDSLNSHKELEGVPIVIMAGGKGTRLYPYTKILPKPLIPIGDIPISERIINRFLEFGANEFYMTLNYRKEMIKAYFADNSQKYNIHYIEENRPLGTAGSLRLIDQTIDKPFIVTNCDILIRADYGEIYEYHKKSGNELTIITALKNITIPYGVVLSGKKGIVKAMQEKPQVSYFINTGMYILNENILKEIPANMYFHMTDLAEKLLEQKRCIGVYPISEDSFLDMGEFEEMYRMEEKLNLSAE